MHTLTSTRRPSVAVALYELLNPIPLGFFVAAWIFDIIYLYAQAPMWTHSASWLIVIGLIIAIIPRVINLFHVWGRGRTARTAAVTLHFWLNLVAIVLAIFNALIHSRDAWAVVPIGVILSTLVVILLLLGNLQLALRVRTV